jgi:hypothetical protein
MITTGTVTIYRRGMILFVCVLVIFGALGVNCAVGGASQQSTADHPLVGAWVIDPEANDPSNPPSYDAFHADGTLVNIGSDGASVGTWEPTGSRTANFTFSGLVAGSEGAAMFIIRGTLEVDESGERVTGDHTFTLVGADGTVMVGAEGNGGDGVRLHTETMDAVGQPLAGFPTWMPAMPAATPGA